jgi:hypothetical protein
MGRPSGGDDVADDSSRHGFAYRFFWFLGVVCVGCLLFLMLDVKHRISGYGAAHHGVLGTVAINECDRGMTGVVCKGDFRSADGAVRRTGIRVNGAPQALHWDKESGKIVPPALMPAGIGDAGAGEAWTVDGTPWLNISRVQMYALVPVFAVVLVLWLVLRQGFGGWSRAYQRSRGRRRRQELRFYRRMFSETPRSRRR